MLCEETIAKLISIYKDDDRPYRREVANAVLEYVEKIVKNRR